MIMDVLAVVSKKFLGEVGSAGHRVFPPEACARPSAWDLHDCRITCCLNLATSRELSLEVTAWKGVIEH